MSPEAPAFGSAGSAAAACSRVAAGASLIFIPYLVQIFKHFLSGTLPRHADKNDHVQCRAEHRCMPFALL